MTEPEIAADDAMKMLKIVCALIARPESEPFRAPVAWKVLGLTDYPKMVKKPMDLGTIKKKLEDGQYKNMSEVADDIRLVWTNCMAYNQDGSEFYHLAGTFARKFEEVYATLRNSDEPDVNRVPSSEERLRLSYDLFKLSDLDLGRTLTIIEGSCPEALSKRKGDDEVMINVDMLKPRTFHEAFGFVEKCMEAGRADAANKRKKV